jgi:hypothetical protein
MIDMVVLSYAQAIRVNGWIGNMMAEVESDLFGPHGLRAKLDARHGRGSTIRGLAVEELVRRLAEQLMPLLDRSNKMLLRNLAALRDHRRPPAPSVSIGRAGQVNVGAQQINLSRGDGLPGTTDRVQHPTESPAASCVDARPGRLTSSEQEKGDRPCGSRD